MNISIFPDYEALSRHTAEYIVQVVHNKPDALLCFASGDTPKLAYQMVSMLAGDAADFSKCMMIGLDEWVGVPPENTGSCAYFLQECFIKLLRLKPAQYHLFNPMASDLKNECINMDEQIHKHGGIDLMIVGIGMNGHIGFNEPGVDAGLLCHVIDLAETTKTVGQKYFTGSTHLTQGITVGLGHLMQAREVILMANGEKKASIVQQAIEGAVSGQLPATIMQRHTNGYVFLDALAAAKLNRRQ